MSKLRQLLLTAALTVPLLATACQQNRYSWTPAEQPHYVQWEHETHRDHVDWNRRSDDEHKQYWDWRKSH
jgi:hypothetical protein